MTVNMLIQVDKLVQLIESPVFTCKLSALLQPSTARGAGSLTPSASSADLRLQLLEPERYPYLYKCLYGLLMLLPQSSAFAALKNRLNSVSPIGYLHISPRVSYVTPSDTPKPNRQSGRMADSYKAFKGHAMLEKLPTNAELNRASSSSTGSSYDRPPRLKGREEGIIRWSELLEKFRSVQERARRAQRHAGDLEESPPLGVGELRIGDALEAKGGKEGRTGNAPPVPAKDTGPIPVPTTKARTGLGKQLGRFGGAVAGRGKRNAP